MRIIVRIRTSPERRVRRSRRPNRRLAHLGAALAVPVALFCFFVCGWRWGYDLGWTRRFLNLEGILSHWQIWFVAGGLLQLLAVRLARYAEPDRRRPGSVVPDPGQDPRQPQIP